MEVLLKMMSLQEIIKEYDNGDVEVRYIVNSYKEIFYTILKFIPNVIILSPKFMQDKLKTTLEEYLKPRLYIKNSISLPNHLLLGICKKHRLTYKLNSIFYKHPKAKHLANIK